NIVLSEDPNLTNHYAALTKLKINIKLIQNTILKQKEQELERTADLHEHGVATGQELLNAKAILATEQSNLANKQASLIEHKTRLISEGFTANALEDAQPGTVYLISNRAESQISNIEKGSSCTIKFNALPGTSFTGKVEAIANVVDPQKRMVKVRIKVDKPTQDLKAG